MTKEIQKNGVLRKRWEAYCRQYRDSIRSVAERAQVDYYALWRAVQNGVASEELRQALADARIPARLIPLPNCPRVLAEMILEKEAGDG